MREKRGAHACAVGPGGQLYALGGYDVGNAAGACFLSAVESFDPRGGAWVQRGSMQLGRAYGAAAWADGTLWAFGGMQGEHYNQTVERWVVWVGGPGGWVVWLGGVGGRAGGRAGGWGGWAHLRSVGGRLEEQRHRRGGALLLHPIGTTSCCRRVLLQV